jgi:hypothetical protein
MRVANNFVFEEGGGGAIICPPLNNPAAMKPVVVLGVVS